MKLTLILIATVFAAGCTSTETAMEKEGVMKNDTMTKTITGEAMMEKNGTGAMMNDTVMKKDYSGTIFAGAASPLLDFNKADDDAALKTGNVVFLYFYATWCPICRAELPHLYAAFDELKTDKVIGFRVNYNDGDTDNDERALAQQYQVPYQHTKVIVKDGKATKYPDSWNKQRYLSEINKAMA